MGATRRVDVFGRIQLNIGLAFALLDMGDEEAIEDIKRKSFMGVKNMERDACLGSQFQRSVETSFKAADPFIRFLCKSVGVPF